MKLFAPVRQMRRMIPVQGLHRQHERARGKAAVTHTTPELDVIISR